MLPDNFLIDINTHTPTHTHTHYWFRTKDEGDIYRFKLE